MFTPIDYLFVAAYIVAVLVIGYIGYRRQSHEGFLIANRQMSPLVGMATINASKTDAVLVFYTALLYTYGTSAFAGFVGLFVGYLIFLPFALRLTRIAKNRYYTLADYFADNFGPLTGKITSVLNVLTMSGYLVINLIAATIIFTFFTNLSFTTAALIILAIIAVYLTLAGFQGVAWTDTLQYAAMIFLLGLFAILLYTAGDTTPALFQVDKVGLGTIIGFWIIGFLSPFGSPDLWQRVYALKEETTIKRSILLSILTYFFVGIFITIVGLVIKTSLPDINPDQALVQGLAQLLPVGFAGLALIVFFSALMSSIDTYVYTAASSLVQDFWRNATKERTVIYIRWAIVGILLISGAIAIAIKSPVDATFVFTAVGALVAVPVIMTWVKMDVPTTIINGTFILGAISFVIILGVDIATASLTPVLIIKTIGGSLVGLALSTVYYFAVARRRL